jgi:DNA-binding NarL/FixJ family response regulator
MGVDGGPDDGRGPATVLAGAPEVSLVAVEMGGRGALSAAMQHRPDLVIVEYAVPGGLALVREVKGKLPATRALVSAERSEPEVLRDALTAGASGMVERGLPLPALVDAIGMAVAGGVVARPALLACALRMNRRAASLTCRELEVLRLLADGRSNPAIAAGLGVSLHTVRHHVRRVVEKLGAQSRLDAVESARRLGLLAEAG